MSLIVVLLPVISHGQENLVLNSDFEEHTDCPFGPGQIDFCLHWTNPTAGQASPDYFHSCCPPTPLGHGTLGVPLNARGSQNAHSGEAYAGIFAFHRNYPNVREYIQIQLIDSIVPTIRYTVSFYVSLADDPIYAVSTLGAYLSKEPITRNDDQRIEVMPQILNTSDNLLTDPDVWVLITDTFSSRYGGERYLTIGNFNTDATSDTVYWNVDEVSGAAAYYYIDDVSVIALDSMPDGLGEVEPLAFQVWPNPAQNHITITAPSALTAASVSIFSISGQRLVSGAYTAQIDISNLPNGIYFIELRNETSIGRRRFLKM